MQCKEKIEYNKLFLGRKLNNKNIKNRKKLRKIEYNKQAMISLQGMAYAKFSLYKHLHLLTPLAASLQPSTPWIIIFCLQNLRYIVFTNSNQMDEIIRTYIILLTL